MAAIGFNRQTMSQVTRVQSQRARSAARRHMMVGSQSFSTMLLPCGASFSWSNYGLMFINQLMGVKQIHSYFFFMGVKQNPINP